MEAELMRKFAINYLYSRFKLTSKFLPSSFESCVEAIEPVMAKSVVNISCQVLLLRALSEKDIQLFKRDFSSEFPHHYELSEIKFVLFHLLMDRIVRYSHSKEDILSFGKSIIDKGVVHMYYWFGSGRDRFGNWGDILGPVIVQKLSRIKVVFADRKTKVFPIFYGIGSILTQAMDDGRSLFTWGSGLIKCPNAKELQIMSFDEKLDHQYFSVRGPETQMAMLALRGVFPRVSKDPGLLISSIFPLEKKQPTKICIIPHYVDHSIVTKALNDNSGKQKSQIKIIQISSNANDFSKFAEHVPTEVLNCKKVLSSSLHGLIVSHSYGIPGAIISLSDKIVGGDFKYRDYYESIGIYINRDLIRHKITYLQALNNVTYLSHLVEITPQPKYPISVDSIIETYPFPLNNFPLRPPRKQISISLNY